MPRQASPLSCTPEPGLARARLVGEVWGLWSPSTKLPAVFSWRQQPRAVLSSCPSAGLPHLSGDKVEGPESLREAAKRHAEAQAAKSTADIISLHRISQCKRDRQRKRAQRPTSCKSLGKYIGHRTATQPNTRLALSGGPRQEKVGGVASHSKHWGWPNMSTTEVSFGLCPQFSPPASTQTHLNFGFLFPVTFPAPPHTKNRNLPTFYLAGNPSLHDLHNHQPARFLCRRFQLFVLVRRNFCI